MPDDLAAHAPYRFYRAVAEELWVLCPRESRQPYPRHAIDTDHRARVLPA